MRHDPDKLLSSTPELQRPNGAPPVAVDGGGPFPVEPYFRPVYTLVRRFIKSGIGFLFIGLALGGWMLVERELLGRWPNPYLASAHAHAVLIGFVMFLILGVALWLFPRAAKDDERYSPARAEAAYWILLVATGGRFLAEASRAWIDHPALGWGVVVGGFGQIAGLGLYFWTMWTRIRPVGSHLREAKGERF